MKNELRVFENGEFGITKVVIVNGEEYFVAKEIAEKLGYTTLQRMYDHVEKEDKIKINPQSIEYQGLCKNGTSLVDNENIFTLMLINESGLYDAIFGSTLPSAKKFKRWVTSEVLPTIRKTGGYINSSDLMVNTYFGNCDETSKTLVKGLLQNIEVQQKQITKLTNEVIHKEDILIGLSKEISLADKRQRITQIVRHGSDKYQDRYRLLYIEFEKKFHVDLDRRLQSEQYKIIKPKIKSKMDLIDRGMGMIPELYEIACKIFENDINELKKEWDSIITRTN